MFGRGADNAPAGSEQKFNQLKQKYQTVLNTIEQQNVRLQNLHIEGDKLYIKGTAPSQQAKDAIWNQIKLVDPSNSDLTADITVEAPQQRAAAVFYGSANEYMRIFYANRDKLSDPDKIQAGQELIIPSE
jgi:hypothetical protein